MLLEDGYRWKSKSGELLSWKETLEAMANYYGTFCGRWHSNEFWIQQKREVTSMDEQQARARILEIEREADRDLKYWQAYQ